jgi:polyisoprenoid-binding protein YceI
MLAVILAAAVLALPAAAEEWKLDPAHSKLKFAIDAKMISAEGVFRTFSVKDDINEQAMEQSKIEMTVDVSSLDTNSTQRDNHLKSDAFFDVAKFPTATILVKSIRKVSEGNYEGDGEITIHGVTKPIKLPARILLNEGGRLRFRGSVEINRMDFGVKFQSPMNHIEDIATVTYELNLQKPRSGGAPPPPKPNQ